MKGVKRHLTKTFAVGLFVWAPIGIALWVFYFAFQKADSLSFFVKKIPYVPDIPGIGLSAAVVILYITGVVAANVLGKKLVHLWQQGMRRSPIFGLLYSPLKDAAESFKFSTLQEAGLRVVMIEYPRMGTWAMGLEVGQIPKDGKLLSIVLMPTPPTNQPGPPTFIAVEEVQEIDWLVADLLKATFGMWLIRRKAINTIKKSP